LGIAVSKRIIIKDFYFFQRPLIPMATARQVGVLPSRYCLQRFSTFMTVLLKISF